MDKKTFFLALAILFLSLSSLFENFPMPAEFDSFFLPLILFLASIVLVARLEKKLEIKAWRKTLKVYLYFIIFLTIIKLGKVFFSQQLEQQNIKVYLTSFSIFSCLVYFFFFNEEKSMLKLKKDIDQEYNNLNKK